MTNNVHPARLSARAVMNNVRAVGTSTLRLQEVCRRLAIWHNQVLSTCDRQLLMPGQCLYVDDRDHYYFCIEAQCGCTESARLQLSIVLTLDVPYKMLRRAVMQHSLVVSAFPLGKEVGGCF
jgi:hypothetical protein